MRHDVDPSYVRTLMMIRTDVTLVIVSRQAR